MTARLYLFPFAGGGPRCYDRLTAQSGFEPVVLAWEPARYRRDGGITRLARELAGRVADDVAARGGRYGLFGHSMGALVAFEVAGALRERPVAGPAMLAVSGRVPPQCGARPAADPGRPDSVAAYLRSCGGELAAAAEDPEFVEIVAERLSDDIGLGVEHRYRARPPLACPVLVFGGLADVLASPAELTGWLDHGRGGALHLLDGGHWFLWRHTALLRLLLADALAKNPATPGDPRS